MSAPRVSILTAAFDASATIEATIASVLAQTEPGWELVVVDDGSTDGTGDLVRAVEDERVRLVVQENAGLSAARNAALAAARGREIALLDADDLLLPGFLAAMGAALDGDPGAGFAHTDAWLLDDATGRIARRTVAESLRPPPPDVAGARDLLRELIRRGNFLYVSAVVRREALDAAGPFDTSLRSLEDYDLWVRLAAAGHRAVRVPGVHAVYRRRPGSMSSNELRMRRTEVQVLRNAVGLLPEGDPLRALAERRAAEVASLVDALTGASPGRAALLRAARLGGRLKRRVADRRLWRPSPPEEVARAFPELAAR